jgi:hypothetical protein
MQQLSVQVAVGALLQHGGAFVPVLCVMQGGAWLFGVGVVACAAAMGTVMIRSAANRRVAVAILRVVFCIYLPQYPTKNITVLYKRLCTKKEIPPCTPSFSF